MKTEKLLLLVVVLSLFIWFMTRKKTKESFFNILPTELIDPQYYTLTEGGGYFDRGSGQEYEQVGLGGVDLNCNAVEIRSILHWIRWNDPDVLNRFVFRYDPSADIYNPDDAPRILKCLLRNLPSQHKYVPLIRNCFPVTVRV